MSVLLIGSLDDQPPWVRALLHSAGCAENTGNASNDPHCEALVVVNRCGKDLTADLQRALEIRRRRPALGVAVLTLVDPGTCPAETAQGADLRSAVCLVDEETAISILRARWPRMQLKLSEDVISLEYQS